MARAANETLIIILPCAARAISGSLQRRDPIVHTCLGLAHSGLHSILNLTFDRLEEAALNDKSPFNPMTQPALFDGVVGKRVMAVVFDAVIILLLTALAYVAVAVLGIFTLGLAWLLFGLVFPVVALGYNALTVGGPNGATVGMRLMGVRVRMWDGAPVSPLIAAFHALLFWFSLVIFAPILLWALFDRQKRCLHDILAGVVVINRL
jgi:uncharacterized RDD family membrane protein YckC